MLHGVINLNKPLGKTSHDMIYWGRKTFSQKRIGHSGTLDPLATGVLLLCMGEATRLAEYLSGQEKFYRAEMMPGYTSATYDSEAELHPCEQDFSFTAGELEAVLANFRGQIMQKPPPYSAISYGGKRLYQLARAGQEVEIAARNVEIKKLIHSAPPGTVFSKGSKITLDILCSKGTYIRSLAHDIGKQLGCGAVLTALTRLKSGGFSLEDALSAAEIEALAADSRAKDALHKLKSSDLGMNTVQIDAAEYAYIKHGRAVQRDYIEQKSDSSDVLLIHKEAIVAVAVYHAESGQLRPHKVFATPIRVEGVGGS